MKSTLLPAAVTAALALCAAHGLAYAQSSGAPVADAMQSIADIVTAQGSVTYTDTVTDTSDNSSWNYTRTVSITNFKVDAAACTLYFHFSAVTSGDAAREMDGWIIFSQVRGTKVEPLETENTDINAQAGHPTWRSSLQPEIYVVSVDRGNGVINDFDFYSQDTANRVAASVRRAAQLCGGSGG